MELYLLGSDPVDSSATTIQNFRKNEIRKSIRIQTKAFSSIKEIEFDLIKIDVEGNESDILASILPHNNKALIIVEILPVYTMDNHERLNRQHKVEQLLIDYHYKIYRILKTSPVRLLKIESIGIHENADECDYLLIPLNKEPEILRKFD